MVLQQQAGQKQLFLQASDVITNFVNKLDSRQGQNALAQSFLLPTITLESPHSKFSNLFYGVPCGKSASPKESYPGYQVESWRWRKVNHNNTTSQPNGLLTQQEELLLLLDQTRTDSLTGLTECGGNLVGERKEMLFAREAAQLIYLLKFGHSFTGGSCN
ncbi:hypothetical protein KY285_007188 [Solanum tuberosum]|nr:hypothetical protein KY285_007188 [Solanum tuberosum]